MERNMQHGNFFQGLENTASDTAKMPKANDLEGGKDVMDTDEPEDKKNVDSDGSLVATYEVERGPQSSIHTNLSLLSLNVS
jgi:hypothetical protein